MATDAAETQRLALAADFPAATREQWRELVAAVLGRAGTAVAEGEAPEAALTATTYDDIEIAPLYTAEDGAPEPGAPGLPAFVRGATRDGATRTGWDVRQRYCDTDAGRLNAAALADLEGGGTSLWLVLGAGALPVADLARALDGVYLDMAPIVVDAGADTFAAAEALLALADERGVARGDLNGTLGADPIGLRARTGAEPDLAALVQLAERIADSPGLRAVAVDATIYHDAGAGDADELAIAASIGLAYLRALTDGGLSVDAALGEVEFRYAVTADQFASIAKLRAARRIWDRIAELSGAGGDRAGQRQHAVTSAAMMTRRDPWVNMLRTTIACFAAAVGGAAAVTVAPFDSAIGQPDSFARRIARNTQSILHDESSLARVVDAAGGSWYVESLTDVLAERAWQRFTAIERNGGALAALDMGLLTGWIAQTRERRADDIAHRRAPITGVSEYALLTEPSVVRPEAPQLSGGGPLAPSRWAAEYEALRDRADAHTADHDARPAVFLAALGPFAAHSARVGFAANLFQAGGIQPVTGTGDAAELAAAFTDSGSSVACLCSSDALYAEQAGAAIEALRAAGAQQVWVAGKPGTVDGADGYVFAGCNALAVLRTTLDTLGVK